MIKRMALKGISKTFSTNSSRQVVALDNVNLNIKAGEFICIVGKTGCGKTTLLRIVAGLESPTSGSILFDDQPLGKFKHASTLVFQQYSLLPWLSNIDNVAFPMELQGISKKERHEKAKELLHLVGLSKVEQAKPYELSGGMQQRVAIARALAYDPEVLLMDEPFGALDERTRKKLQDLLIELWEKRKKTIIFVTHNIDEAITMGDRVLVMASDPGRIVDELKIKLLRPRNRLDASFTEIYLKLRNVLELTD